MNRLFAALLSIIIATVVFISLAQEREIRIENKVWTYKDKECFVSFDMVNKSAYPQFVYVSIRILSGRNRFLGHEMAHKEIEVKLDSLENRHMEEKIRVSGRPNLINVKAWKANRNITHSSHFFSYLFPV